VEVCGGGVNKGLAWIGVQYSGCSNGRALDDAGSLVSTGRGRWWRALRTAGLRVVSSCKLLDAGGKNYIQS